VAALYIVIGLAGMAIALVGAMQPVYPLVAVGVVMIFAAFFLFSRTNQGTPAPAGPDESSRTR
jgi:uncharacterized membrane protein YbaN (DUF454 family)